MNKKMFIIAIIILCIDQVTKLLISTSIDISSSVIIIKDFFSLVNVSNTGAAFSILEGRTWFLTLLTVVIFIMLIKMSKSYEKSKLTTWAFGLLTGGIFGNFLDRLFLGYVRDFLKFKIFGYNFPIFNIADMCIVIGIIILIIYTFKGEKNEVRSTE